MDQGHNNIRKTYSEQFQPFQVDQEDSFVFQQKSTIDLAMEQIQLQQFFSEKQKNNKIGTLPLIPVSQIDVIIQSSNAQGLRPSQQERSDLQQQAKQLLIEESQHTFKNTHFQLKLFKKLNQHPHSHNIQSFHQDELAQNKPKASIINKIRSNKSSNNYNLHQFRNRRMSILSRKDSQVRQSQQTRKVIPSQQLMNTFLGKMNPSQKVHSGGNEFDPLGHKYLSLQQQYNQRKPRIVMKSFHHRCKTQTSHLTEFSNNRNSQQKQLLAFYIRRLISPHTHSLTHLEQPSQQHLRTLSTLYHNFKPSNTNKHSRYSSDANLNRNYSIQQQGTYNRETQYNKQRKSGGQLVRQKIHNIFQHLKQLRNKQLQLEPHLPLHQKMQINSNSLHNIHSDQPRQYAGLNFHWNRERNKLRNASLKNQTIDFYKLSLKTNETQNEYGRSGLKTKKSKGETIQYRTEPNQGQCAIISPVFLTNKP